MAHSVTGRTASSFQHKMLMEIEWSGLDWANANRSNVQLGLSKLLAAHREGRHLLILHRGFADWSIKTLGLGEQDNALLKQLRGEFTQSYDLTRRVSVRICIVPENIMPEARRGSTIHVGIQEILRTCICDPTVLIAEDLDADGSLYSLIIKNIMDTRLNIGVALDIRHGGGEQISKIVNHEVKSQKIVCSLIDTDKKFPSSAVCLKEKKIRKYIDGFSWPLAFLYVLPCHEIENVIPVEVMRTVVGMADETLNIIEKIEEIERSLGFDALDRVSVFFDWKEGADFSRGDGKERELAWLEARLKKCGFATEGLKIAGLGGGIVRRTLESNKACDQLYKSMKTDVWQERFGRIFSEISWMFLAAKKRAI